MKILFCNIGWSKEYKGITDEDPLVNGGSFVEKNGEGCEAFNFCHVNRRYYGYVFVNGTIHIERLDGSSKKNDFMTGVTVVWMASPPDRKGTYIVGWYKNATVYREWQYYEALFLGDDNPYQMVCDVADGMLLPVAERTFAIPSALEEGRGKGKGRSNIWYADSLDAQRDFVPQVTQYIEGYRGPSMDIVDSPEALAGTSVELLGSAQAYLLRSEALGNSFEAIQCLNSAWNLDPSEDNSVTLAEKMICLGYMDEAVQVYERQLELGRGGYRTLFKLAEGLWLAQDYKHALEVGGQALNALEAKRDDCTERFGAEEFEVARLTCLLIQGRCCLTLGHFPEATSYYRRAIETAGTEELRAYAQELLEEASRTFPVS